MGTANRARHIFSCWQNTEVILIYQKYFKITEQAQLCKSQNKISRILYQKLFYHCCPCGFIIIGLIIVPTKPPEREKSPMGTKAVFATVTASEVICSILNNWCLRHQPQIIILREYGQYIEHSAIHGIILE